jgi:two-component system response regulator MprA
MIVLVLSRHYPGVKISEASDGVEALEAIALNKPSVLITDVMMPHMDGVALLNALQQQGKMVPTLIFSGYMSPQLFEEEISNSHILKSGKIIFLSKPFKSDEFLQAIEALVERSD